MDLFSRGGEKLRMHSDNFVEEKELYVISSNDLFVIIMKTNENKPIKNILSWVTSPIHCARIDTACYLNMVPAGRASINNLFPTFERRDKEDRSKVKRLDLN